MITLLYIFNKAKEKKNELHQYPEKKKKEWKEKLIISLL